MTKLVIQEEVAKTLKAMLGALLQQSDGLIDVEEVCRRTSLSRTTVYELEHSGGFPKRRQIGRNKVGWLVSEISEWIATRPTVDVAREREAATRT